MIKSVCVYCASSTKIAECYKKEARRFAEILSENKIRCFYGGGNVGLMGELSRTMVSNGGSITGIIPQFMIDEGWYNKEVEQIIVDTMHQRKGRMLEDVDAVVAMPGGCGTLEELMEAITWKQLGIFTKPIIILNINGYFDPLLAMLDKAIDEKFMRNEHRQMWGVANCAEEILTVIDKMPAWGKEAIGFAAL